jgi:ankyrin repeat protein
MAAHYNFFLIKKKMSNDSDSNKNLQKFVENLKKGKKRDIKKKFENGEIALHIACHERYLDIVTLLIEKGANINEKDYIENTHLHHACNCANLNVVTLLIEKGADSY